MREMLEYVRDRPSLSVMIIVMAKSTHTLRTREKREGGQWRRASSNLSPMAPSFITRPLLVSISGDGGGYVCVCARGVAVYSQLSETARYGWRVFWIGTLAK